MDCIKSNPDKYESNLNKIYLLRIEGFVFQSFDDQKLCSLKFQSLGLFLVIQLNYAAIPFRVTLVI